VWHGLLACLLGDFRCRPRLGDLIAENLGKSCRGGFAVPTLRGSL
jgi:hypothetical protein